MANITGFLPYFYVAQPRGFREEDLEPFRRHLNVCFGLPYQIICNLHVAQGLIPGPGDTEAVVSVELVSKRSLWQYRGDDWIPFIKLTIVNPKTLPKVRDEYLFLIEYSVALIFGYPRAFERNECRYQFFSTEAPITTFESNIAYTLRFMIDTKVLPLV